MKTNSSGPVIAAFAAGAIAGAVTALLLAPRSGPDTRRLIRRKTKDAASQAMSDVEKLAKRVPEAVRDAGDAGRRAFAEAIGS